MLRILPAGFIAPCLPSKTGRLPSGGEWLHEIKHDGLRVIARKKGAQVRLYSRPGNDLTYRFPLIVETLKLLRSRSCIIDGEAVACDENGVTSFNRVRYRRHDDSIFLYAFDLIELNGDDLRWDPLEGRKETLAMILAKAGSGIRFNEHMEGDGEAVFRHACKLGLEGIVSKRKDSPYRSGRSPDWLKMKNADAPAVKREAEEEWGKRKRRGLGRLASSIEAGEVTEREIEDLISDLPRPVEEAPGVSGVRLFIGPNFDALRGGDGSVQVVVSTPQAGTAIRSESWQFKPGGNRR